jgi:hypothetical protein
MTSTPSPTASEQAASRAARPREAGRWTNAQARSVVGAATVVRGPSRSAELRAFAARLLSAHGLREPAGSDGHRPGERSPTPRGTVALRWNTPIRLSVGSDSQCGRDSQRGIAAVMARRCLRSSSRHLVPGGAEPLAVCGRRDRQLCGVAVCPGNARVQHRQLRLDCGSSVGGHQVGSPSRRALSRRLTWTDVEPKCRVSSSAMLRRSLQDRAG